MPQEGMPQEGMPQEGMLQEAARRGRRSTPLGLWLPWMEHCVCTPQGSPRGFHQICAQQVPMAQLVLALSLCRPAYPNDVHLLCMSACDHICTYTQMHSQLRKLHI